MLKLDIFFNGIGSIKTDNINKMYEYRVQGLKKLYSCSKTFFILFFNDI